MAFPIIKHCFLNISKELILEHRAMMMTTVAIVNSKTVFNHNNQNHLGETFFSTTSHLRQFKSKDHEKTITAKGNSKFHSTTNLYAQQPMLKLQQYREQQCQTQQQYKEARSDDENQFESDIESDDEYERNRLSLHQKFSERGDSEFWRRKMRTLHRILDVNRDGVISFDDFDLFTKRFISLGHISPALAKEFTEVMRQTWIEQFGPIEPYNLITSEQFLTDLHHRLNDEEMCKRVGHFLPYLFKAVDYDHSGCLDLNQYKLFFKCLGLSDEDAAISFAAIDRNGDGEISLQEFIHLGRQYFLTEDDTKISKMFWGPLISDY